jgi:5-aminopentanamidase
VKVAAFQAPLLPAGSMEALALIRERIDWCESAGVEILCCPEGVLGGLEDYAPQPAGIAIGVEGGRLDEILAPLASGTVTTILGFTELGPDGRLYNSAAVFHRGAVAGVYRKLHPAINRSVYAAGDATPVFTIGGLTFGIVICRDSTFPDPARRMVAQGAEVLFIPTNNGLPRGKAKPERVAEAARNHDITRATENGVWIVRADVAGECGDFVAFGSTEIVAPDGTMVAAAQPFAADLIVADVAWPAA